MGTGRESPRRPYLLDEGDGAGDAVSVSGLKPAA
jgi:hypothetical protein